MEKPEELSPIITHLAGREEKKFPLSFLTEGVGNTKSINRFEYEYRVKTHEVNVRPVVRVGGGTAGGGPVNTTIGHNHFPRQVVHIPIHSRFREGKLARIMQEPVAVSDGYQLHFAVG